MSNLYQDKIWFSAEIPEKTTYDFTPVSKQWSEKRRIKGYTCVILIEKEAKPCDLMTAIAWTNQNVFTVAGDYIIFYEQRDYYAYCNGITDLVHHKDFGGDDGVDVLANTPIYGQCRINVGDLPTGVTKAHPWIMWILYSKPVP
ncbi:MAG: hypothetical protein HXX80_04765 [Nitrososphaerales archaeon]|nr:hypothetical protein [Nitrososphaerales archaeon]